MIKSVNPVAFKAYVPVSYFVKDSETGEFDIVTDHKNIKKCHSFVVRNLNGTAGKKQNDEFINFYRKCDSDYRQNPEVISIYDKYKPIVHLVSGNDVSAIQEFAKPVGKAKGEALDKIGRSRSYESRMAARTYFKNAFSYIRNTCRRLKSSDNQKLGLNVYFTEKINKRGEVIGFDYLSAEFQKVNN